MDDLAVTSHDFERAPRGARSGAAPWYFLLGRFLSRRGIRGGDRLVIELRRRGLLDRTAVYSLGDRVRIRVPLWRECNAWDARDARDYEASLIATLADWLRGRDGVTLIDCGADIGTISMHIAARCPHLARVIAYEPNPVAHRVLAQNFASLPFPAEAHRAAVGDFRGRGVLVRAPDDPSAHAMYVVPSRAGTVCVERIDDLALAPGAPCAIKIDVEGDEAAVVAGAARTIHQAGPLFVAFEAHAGVARRTGRDPVEVMRLLRAMRPDATFDAEIATMGQLGGRERLSPDRPVFDQLVPAHNYNIVARSAAPARR